MSSGPPPEGPRARFGAPRATPNRPKSAPEPPRATSNSQSWHAQNPGNMCIWHSGISKKRSRTIFRCSECSPGTLRSGDPHPQGRPRAPQTRPGSAQAPPRTSPGPPRAPLDHPCEFHSCNILFENLRFSDFTRFSNCFLTFFKYTNRFAKWLISVFTHISNGF